MSPRKTRADMNFFSSNMDLVAPSDYMATAYCCTAGFQPAKVEVPILHQIHIASVGHATYHRHGCSTTSLHV
jgi:hypothetical protein